VLASVARMRPILALLAATLVLAAPAAASPYLQSGVQDDAWLRYGPGTLDGRVATLKQLGVEVVRYTLDWRELEPRRGSYDWRSSDKVLLALRASGIAPVVTLWGTPKWANGGRGPSWAPTSKWTFAAFAGEAAKRYPFVSRWLVWNEPNKAPFLRPTSAKVYVQRLLNPAYNAIHRVNRRARVGGGVTGPIAGRGGVSPIVFIRSMRAHRAKLDAYAHNPYPARPRQETPFAGGCQRCATITMATLDKLLALVGQEFPRKRIWLTEYAYQSNPPDRYLGVSPALQARYVSEGALRAFAAPRVDMLIHYIVRDDGEPGGWQSGLFAASGKAKPAYHAFRFPLAQRSRRGLRTVVWGQMRPRSGRQTYRLQQFREGRWRWVGAARRTSARGMFAIAVRAGKGSRLRVWSPRDKAFGAVLTVR
jgi:hypothetical protein